MNTLTQATNTTQTSPAYGPTLLRITLGALLLTHGIMKAYVWGVPGTVGFFGSIGLPPIVAYLTIFGELAGGMALLFGVLTRLAALLVLPILLGATWAHSGNGFIFSNANGGWEFPAFLVAIAIIVAVQGPGSLALGRRLPLLRA